MPTYVYRCDNGHEFEVVQSMSADALTTCQTCDAHAQRVLFAPSIVFKGSGFHNTDYGTKRRPVGGDGDSSATKTADTASSGGDSGSSGSSSESSSSSKTVGLDTV